MRTTRMQDLAVGLFLVAILGVLLVLSIAFGKPGIVCRQAGQSSGSSVVDALEMPCPVDAIQVDEGQPARPGNLEIVPIYRLAPPRLFHSPAIADFDRFLTTIPTECQKASARIQLDLDGGMLP